ncbi:MAG: hypothetical protein K6C36_02930 [Clostridia bacterium]|nr:hypothetical protein [Clostridia bacterium]
MKKVVSFILAATLVLLPCFFAFAAQPAGVETNAESYVAPQRSHVKGQDLLDKIVRGLVKAVAVLIPGGPNFVSKDDMPTEGFMEGMADPAFSSAQGATWSAGFDTRSLITAPDDIIGKCYVGGTMSVMSKKYATAIEDDLTVHTLALSDGVNGTVVFVVLDCFGVSSPTVREIRSELADFSAENGIAAINVSALHQHSAVDTMGLNGDLVGAVFVNPWKNLFGLRADNGQNAEYMENLVAQSVASVKAAVGSMTEGALYYGTADATKYLYDKRQPFVNDPNFNRFRFVPSDGGKETWLVTSSIHCVGNGAAGTVITADYPYYAEQTVNAAGANCMFIMGAQQSNTLERNADTVVGYTDDMDRLDSLKGFGYSIGSALTAIDNDVPVAPHLAAKYATVTVELDNPILLLAGKTGLITNYVYREGTKRFIESEIGYMELGNDLAFAFFPGELAPELAFGGCLGAEYSWSGTDWEYPSMQDIVNERDANRTLLPFSLSNDQLGYIVPDNNYIAFLAEESGSTEFVSVSRHAASVMIEAFEDLIGGIGA